MATANPYYTPSGVPATQTRGVSASMRSEFDSVADGFDDVYAEILALAAEIGVPTNVTEVPVASSSVTDIGDNNGPVILITGTNAITSFGTNYKGGIFIRFAGILTLTHSSSLVLPGAANITTAANDIAIAVPIGDPASGWRVMAYCRMSKPLIDDDAIRASVNYANPSWLTALAWSKITSTPTTISGYGITDAPTKTGTGATGSWGINITGWAKNSGAGADIASATTIDATARTGNIFRVTGTTQTTAITMANGDQFTAIAAAAWPVNIAGVLTHTCIAGDSIVFYQDSSGVQHAQVIRTTPNLMRGYIDGCIMSTAGSSATMTIGGGQATDSTNAVNLNLAASISKTTSAWAVGSAAGGLDTGTIANATWYYFYLIRRPDTGVVDVVFSTNSSTPTLPANYTQYRYIGAWITNGSGQWENILQIGNMFFWKTPPLDFNGAGSTTAVLLSLSVPRGRKMRAFFNTLYFGNFIGYLSDPDMPDLAPSTASSPLVSMSSTGTSVDSWGSQVSCSTSTNGQIRYRNGGTNTWRLATVAWMDLRGSEQ